MRELVRDLALTLRETVLPQLGSHAARAHEQTAVGGDVTFAIDAEAERTLEAAFEMTRIVTGQLDAVASANPALHGAILKAVDAGFSRVSG